MKIDESLFDLTKTIGAETSNQLVNVGRSLVGQPATKQVREWISQSHITNGVSVTPDFSTPIKEQFAQAGIVASDFRGDLSKLVFPPLPQPSVRVTFLTSARFFTPHAFSEMALLLKTPPVSLPVLLAIWWTVAEVRPRSPIIGLDIMLDHQGQPCLPGISFHRGNPGYWHFGLLPWWLELRASCRLAIILPERSVDM